MNLHSSRTLISLFVALYSLSIFLVYVDFSLNADPTLKIAIAVLALSMLVISAILFLWGHYKFGRSWALRDTPIGHCSSLSMSAIGILGNRGHRNGAVD